MMLKSKSYPISGSYSSFGSVADQRESRSFDGDVYRFQYVRLASLSDASALFLSFNVHRAIDQVSNQKGNSEA